MLLAVTTHTRGDAPVHTRAPAPVHADARPLRADAERNRAKILEAAADVFADAGLDATLHDVAARAGVGVGTVYRRFPHKEALLGALFDDKLREVIDVVERAGAEPDS